MFVGGSPPEEVMGAAAGTQKSVEEDFSNMHANLGIEGSSPMDAAAKRQFCGAEAPVSVRLAGDDVHAGRVAACQGDGKPFDGDRASCSSLSLGASKPAVHGQVEGDDLPQTKNRREEETDAARPDMPTPSPLSFSSSGRPPSSSERPVACVAPSDSYQEQARDCASAPSLEEEEAHRSVTRELGFKGMQESIRDPERSSLSPSDWGNPPGSHLLSESVGSADGLMHALSRRDRGKGDIAVASRLDSLVAESDASTEAAFRVENEAQNRSPCFLLQGLVDALAPREAQISVHVAEHIPALESAILRFATNRAKLRFCELFLRGLKARKHSPSWSFMIPGVVSPQTGLIFASGSPFHWPLGLAGAIVEAEERAERALLAVQGRSRAAGGSPVSPLMEARGAVGEIQAGSPWTGLLPDGAGGASRNPPCDCVCLCHVTRNKQAKKEVISEVVEKSFAPEAMPSHASVSRLTQESRWSQEKTQPTGVCGPGLQPEASPPGWPRPSRGCSWEHSDVSLVSSVPDARAADSAALVSPVGYSHADPASDFALISFVFSAGPQDDHSPSGSHTEAGDRRSMHRGSETPSCLHSSRSQTSNNGEDASAEVAFPLESVEADVAVSPPSSRKAEGATNDAGVPGGPWLVRRRHRRDRGEARKAETPEAGQGDDAPTHAAVSADRGENGTREVQEKREKKRGGKASRTGRSRRKNKPITIKSYVVSSDTWQLGCIEYGSHSMSGQRAYNEDRVCVVPSVDVCTREGCCKAHTKAMFYAVYDGHNGEEAVNYVQEHLHKNIFRSRSFHGDVSKAIRAGFIATDNALRSMVMEKIRGEGFEDQDISPFSSGTTACTAVVRDMQLYIGNLGDSRCVLSRAGRSHLITVDHSCRTNADEQQRVREDGGHYDTDGYLNGAIGVSRAFGAFDKNCGQKLSGLTCEPQIHKETLRREDEFMIIACDGVFDVISCQEAVNCVRKHLRGGGTAETAAQALCKFAFERRSLDNLSAVIAVFQPPERLQHKDKRPADWTPTTPGLGEEKAATAEARPSSSSRSPLAATQSGASAGDRTGVSGGGSGAAGSGGDRTAAGEGPPRRRINFAALKGLL
ncbi:protein phosphatase 2C domain-containing protein [Toxoplasma gondii VAND]|uniref:Protein phosphatase 2C domain-containing protein n=1 Tax=Toxoplasma gondii VAND TaxID=933077 RepID=A0A086QLK7_TOXGO|nr:protein phosphatase 2C domain-containing protein [Toxoplasma gondii VAND]